MAKAASSRETDDKLAQFAMPEESKMVIKDIFQSKDKSGTGEISEDDLEECLMSIGFFPSQEDLDFLKKHFDEDGNGKLEIKELMDNLDVINMHSLYGDDLMHAFKHFARGSEFIRYPQLVKILTSPGEFTMDVKKARKLVNYLARNFDANGDGKFSYPEFVRICLSDCLPFRFS